MGDVISIPVFEKFRRYPANSTQLILSANNIVDLDWMRAENNAFEHLECLSLYDNQIDDMSKLANFSFPNLKKLSVANNPLSSIDWLTKLNAPKLEEFYAFNCDIQFFKCEYLDDLFPNIRLIDLSNNPAKSIAVLVKDESIKVMLNRKSSVVTKIQDVQVDSIQKTNNVFFDMKTDVIEVKEMKKKRGRVSLYTIDQQKEYVRRWEEGTVEDRRNMRLIENAPITLIYQWRKKHGTNKSLRTPKYSLEYRQLIVNAWEQATSHTQRNVLLKKENISRNTVYTWVREYGTGKVALSRNVHQIVDMQQNEINELKRQVSFLTRLVYNKLNIQEKEESCYESTEDTSYTSTYN